MIFGLKEALAIMLLRTTISAMLFTTLSTLMYSLPAGLVSLLVMYYLLKLFKDESALVSVSMISAVSHNLTQLVVAIVVLEQVRIAYLLPWLVLMAVPTGLFVGYLAIVMIRYIKRSVPRNKTIDNLKTFITVLDARYPNPYTEKDIRIWSKE